MFIAVNQETIVQLFFLFGPFQTSFSLFVFSLQSLVLEVTTLPTEPQPKCSSLLSKVLPTGVLLYGRNQ